MTMLINAARRPLPVVLDPTPDELLSSWLHRHAAFYGLTEPMLISWLKLESKKLRSLDFRPGLGRDRTHRRIRFALIQWMLSP